MTTGQLLTVEGIEGAGKSTHLDFIRQRLTAAGLSVLMTREPGGTPLGEEIRSLLLSRRQGGMAVESELLLMFAARSEHLARVIRPALNTGHWVVSDRFVDASYAYQGGGRGIPVERIQLLEQWVQGDLRPDYTILFDLDAHTGLSRARSRGEADRFEQEDIEFFNRIRRQYLTMAKASPERYRIINATPELAHVQQQIKQVVDDIVKRHTT